MRLMGVTTLLLLGAACSRVPDVGSVASGIVGCGVEPDASVLFDELFLRHKGKSATASRVFAAEGNATAQLCLEANDLGSGSVSLNGASLMVPKQDKTQTASVNLLPANELAVELHGKPCNATPDCATLRVRVFGAPRPPLQVSAEVAPNTCCSDPACDRAAFAARGGICPGDPRIRGPLPPHAPAASAGP